MILRALVILGLFGAPLWGQQTSFSDFSGGLNTRISSVLLQDNESPSLQNVVLDKNGAISRRQGFSNINSVAIGGGAADVNAVFQFDRSNGNKYCVAFSSTSGYYSTDGCGSFTQFISTLTAGNDVNCDAYGDNLYCANNQYDFFFNGTDDVTFAGPSDLDFIRVFRNRCFGTGKDTNSSRLYWSNLGDCNTWTTATDYVDLDAEDGDVITGIGPDLYDLLIVYKKFSTYAIQFDNANPSNRKAVNISRSTGAKNHRSIANYNGAQFFQSVGPHGGQPGIYYTDGIKVVEATGKIRSELEGLSNFNANSGRRSLDTKADWDAGTFDPFAMSSARGAGFMQSSYTAISQTTSEDWSQGILVNLSTGDIPGSLSLSSSTIQDDFSDLNYTSNLTWNIIHAGGGFDAAAGYLNVWNVPSDGLGYPSIGTSFVWSTGSLSVSMKFASGDSGYVYMFPQTLTQQPNGYRMYYVTGHVQFQRRDGTVLYDFGAVTGWHKYTFVRWTGGSWNLSLDDVPVGTASDNTYTSSVGMVVEDYNNGEGVQVDDIYYSLYVPSGSYTSPIFDTAISTPIGGKFVSTTTSVPGESNADFFIRQSSANNGGGWSGWVATSDTLHILMGKRYQQILVNFYTNISTNTPALNAFSFVAASTGTWTSGELFLTNAMTNWGAFQTQQTVTGSGASIAYAMRVSTYAGGTASTASFTVTPGSAISHSTGAYVVVMGTWTVYSATETARLDILVINWNEGTSAKSATMAVYKNRLHFCGQTSTGLYNDACYVMDDRGAWVKWSGIDARHLNVVNQNFTAGKSNPSGGGFVHKLYDSDSDDGAAINAFWESKDFPLGNIQNVKAIDRLFIIGSPEATTLTATLRADTGLRSLGYDVDFSTGMGFKIVHKVIDEPLNGNVFRIRFENNAASKPWDVLGFGLLYRDLGLGQP